MTPVMQVLDDAMKWRRDSFRGPADFSLDLTAEDRRELLAAVAAVRRAGRLTPAHALTPRDFTFGGLAIRLRQGYEAVRAGRGFVVLRGLPVDDITLEEFIAAVWGIGTGLGRPLSQNAQGELVGHVIDATAEEKTPRMFRSNLELRPHTDWTAMLSLACWRSAPEGGVSYLVSAVTIHDEIARRAPHLLETLYRGFHYHRLGEEGEGEEPVTPYRVPVFAIRNGHLSCRYQRTSLAGGHRALGLEFSDLEIEALDMFDAVARAPENRLAFRLERGDMVVINNYTLLHARTRFTAAPTPGDQRHLVRLWLDADGFRDAPREHNLFAVNGVPPQPGRACTFDFRKLYGDDPRATGGMPSVELNDAELVRGR